MSEHICDNGNFDRTICACGLMHSYCDECAKRQEECEVKS